MSTYININELEAQCRRLDFNGGDIVQYLTEALFANFVDDDGYVFKAIPIVRNSWEHDAEVVPDTARTFTITTFPQVNPITLSSRDLDELEYATTDIEQWLTNITSRNISVCDINCSDLDNGVDNYGFNPNTAQIYGVIEAAETLHFFWIDANPKYADHAILETPAP